MYLCITDNNYTMNKPRLIILILFALCAFTPVSRAQLIFSPDAWDFGDIREVDGRVSHTFTGENRGDKPVVILDVVASCGCTVPEFTRQPIRPGEKTVVKVTFDPANRPGAFTKELGVYSSERRKIASLTVQGTVTPRPKSVDELYPVDAGEGLRLSTTLCAFSYIYPGRQTQSTVGYINTSERPVRLALRPRESSGLLTAEYPRQIAPGARGEINLSYLIPADKPRYGTLKDALEVRSDDRSNGTLLVVHGIGVDKPENGPKQPAPKVQIAENIIKFGPVKHASAVQQRPLTLTNTGEGELIVRAVETGGKATTTLAPGQRIPAGSSRTAQVRFEPRKQEFGVMTDYVLIVTNDPARPMRRLRVTAIIED